MVLTRTIKMFSEKLKKSKEKISVVLPEGWNKKIIDSARYLCENDLCKVVLLITKSNQKDLLLEKHENAEYITVNPNFESVQKDELADSLYENRKHKGMTLEAANRLINMTNYYGTMLVKENICDAYVGGIEYSTRDTLRPALQIVKTSKDAKWAGDYFLMEKDDKRFIYTNCAVNLNPTSEELVELAYTSILFAKKIGVDKPKVAFLSYSTCGSGIGESAEKVRKAVQMAKKDKRFKNISIPCELQFDSAFVEEIRKKKAPQNTWKGSADIYLFPTLDAGNIAYKITQRLGGYIATGPLLSGLASPMNDLSRGSTIQDIVSTIILTASMVEK